MNRTLIPILLMLALVFVQGLQLHGHAEMIPHSVGAAATADHDYDHEHVHVNAHSHLGAMGPADHLDVLELDVAGVAGLGHSPVLPLFALVLAWALLQALWVCISRWPPPRPSIHHGPPRFSYPTLRAPPF